MVESFVALWESGCRNPPVALCLLVGEEETGDGAEKLLEEYHFPWAVIGEPTDLIPCLSHYGYLEIQLATHGKRMHASLATNRQNPVDAMLRLMLRISHYMEKVRPESVYNFRDLFSPQAGFVVPERCEARLDIHLPPAAPIGVIITELEEIAARERQNSARVGVSLRVQTIDAGYDLPEKGELVDALKPVYARRSLPWAVEAFRSHSDANQLWAAGVKPILLGPGRLEMAHAPDESIPFRQVVLASEIYLDLLESLCFSKG
jgi:acetylornithine deacetylase